MNVPTVTRRAFLRYLAFGALAGLGAWLGRRSDTCTKKSICDACRQVRSCGLPAALAYRAKERG